MIDFNEVEDEDLYGMCIEGDEGAWQYMYNFMLTICKWGRWDLREEPEELAQKITLHLIEDAIKKVKKKSSFRSFVKRMTVNKILDSFKAAKPVPSLDECKRNKKGEDFVPEHIDPHPTHGDIIESMEALSTIEKAIQSLPSSCIKIVTEYLNFKMGMYKDYKELSKVLGMPVPTISSKARRCLNKLLQFREIKELRG